jgi:hypothetical protein
VNHRTSGAPIETRCSVAEARGDDLTLWSTTQVPHIARFVFSGGLLSPDLPLQTRRQPEKMRLEEILGDPMITCV